MRQKYNDCLGNRINYLVNQIQDNLVNFGSPQICSNLTETEALPVYQEFSERGIVTGKQIGRAHV